MSLPECGVRFDVGGKTMIVKENVKEAVIIILDGDENKAELYSNANPTSMLAAAATIVGAFNRHLKCRTPADMCPYHTRLRAIQFDLEALMIDSAESDGTHDHTE